MAELDRKVRVKRHPITLDLLTANDPGTDIEKDDAWRDLDLRGYLFRSGFVRYPSEPDYVRTMLARLEEVPRRLEVLEYLMQHSVQPTLRKVSRFLGHYPERDPLPAAASREYDWRKQLKRMSDTVTLIGQVFEDLHERLRVYVELTDQSEQLLRLARATGSRHLREAALFLHDAVRGTYSEDLTIAQVEALGSVLETLQDFDLDREKVWAVDQKLRSSGFETVPSDKFRALQDVHR